MKLKGNNINYILILVLVIFLGISLKVNINNSDEISILKKRNKIYKELRKSYHKKMFERDSLKLLSINYRIEGNYEAFSETEQSIVRIQDVLARNKFYLYISDFNCINCVEDIVKEATSYANINQVELVVLTNFNNYRKRRIYLSKIVPTDEVYNIDIEDNTDLLPIDELEVPYLFYTENNVVVNLLVLKSINRNLIDDFFSLNP